MNNKFMVLLILTVIILLLVPAQAQAGRGWGVGLFLGEPVGVSLKTWIGRKTALDAAVAWSFSEERLYVHGDYLFHNFSLISVDAGELPVYYGIGGRVHFSANTHAGVRVPLGLNYIFDNRKFDIFLEVAPTLNLIPESGFYVGFALGARYFFNQ